MSRKMTLLELALDKVTGWIDNVRADLRVVATAKNVADDAKLPNGKMVSLLAQGAAMQSAGDFWHKDYAKLYVDTLREKLNSDTFSKRESDTFKTIASRINKAVRLLTIPDVTLPDYVTVTVGRGDDKEVFTESRASVLKLWQAGDFSIFSVGSVINALTPKDIVNQTSKLVMKMDSEEIARFRVWFERNYPRLVQHETVETETVETEVN